VNYHLKAREGTVQRVILFFRSIRRVIRVDDCGSFLGPRFRSTCTGRKGSLQILGLSSVMAEGRANLVGQ